MDVNERDKKNVAAVIAAAVVVGIGVYAAFDPGGSGYFPRCVFKMATGLECPGCGSQRAIHELLHGHLGEAFRQNVFFVAGIPVAVLFLVAGIFKKHLRRLYNGLFSTPAAIGILCVTLLWWILRNILGI